MATSNNSPQEMAPERTFGLPFLFLVPLLLILVGIVSPTPYRWITLAAVLVPAAIIGRNLKGAATKRSLLTCLLAIFVLSSEYINFLRVPGWYPFGWHNLMQLDAIYSAISRVDLNYFGNDLSYPYFGLLPLSLLGQLSNLSPLKLFLVCNALCFVAWFATYASYTRRIDSKADAEIAAAAAFLYSGLGFFAVRAVGAAVHHLGFAGDVDFSLLIEGRVSPIFVKYFHIDAMTIALPSLALQYYFSQARTTHSLMLSGLFGLQAILSYPLLGPMVLLVPAAAIVLDRRQRLFNAALTVAFGLCLYATIGGLSKETGSSGVSFAGLSSVGFNLLSALVICAPFLAPVLLRAYRLKSVRTVGEPLLISAAAGAAFCLLQLPAATQYKFLYGAMVILGFPACTEIAYWISKIRTHRRLVIGVLLLLGYGIATVDLARHAPPLKDARPLIDGAAFFVSTPESRQIMATLSRDNDLPSRGLAILRTDFAASAFLRTPVYFNLYKGLLVGYTMSYADMNTSVKRLDKGEYEQRRRIASAIMNDRDYRLAQDLKTTYGANYVLLISDSELPECPGVNSKVPRSYDEPRAAVSFLFVCRL